MRWWSGLLAVGAMSLACSGAGTTEGGEEPATDGATDGATPEPAPTEPAPADGEEDEDEDEGGGRRKSKLPALGPDEPIAADCALKIGDVEASLAKEQPGARPTRFKHGLGRAVEKVRYTDGRELRVVTSGCADVIVTWAFAPVTGDDLVKLAKEHFDVKMKDDATKPLPLTCIDNAKDAPDGFACGEGHASLKKDGEVLTFEYTFPL